MVARKYSEYGLRGPVTRMLLAAHDVCVPCYMAAPSSQILLLVIDEGYNLLIGGGTAKF